MSGPEELLQHALAAFQAALPTLLTILLVSAGLAIAYRLLRPGRRLEDGTSRVVRQVAMLAVTAAGVVAIVLSLPVGDQTRGQLLGLLGLLLSAAIALSSTTMIGNAMAGLMLRAVGNFVEGDFVEVNGFRGRVSERGVLHVEIQTEDRDLVTLPNLYLVSTPVKVVRSSGTILSANISLGYDVAHSRIEKLLVEAAGDAGLEDPYVQIVQLGDFSVTYRASGFLADVVHLLSARTKLHRAVLDALHADGVEIVSPTFMNQRVLHEKQRFIPATTQAAEPASAAEPERIVYDKAEAAAERTRLTGELKQLQAQLEALADSPETVRTRTELERSIQAMSRAIESLPDSES